MHNLNSVSRRQFMVRGGRTGAVLFGASTLTPLAWPQSRSWPSQAVKVVVPVGPGGQTDLFARFICDHLSKSFGQPFVVDNKPGAAGKIGTQQLLAAPTDGHTLLFSAASFTVVPQAIQPNMPYDVTRDLAPIVQIGAGGNFLAVTNDLPVRNMQELVNYVRSRSAPPGYGSHGIGTVTHILMSSLIKNQNLKMTHVPYKSGAEVLKDMIGNVLPIGWVDTTNGAQAAKSGRIRLLGVSGTFRVPSNMDVPTIAEQGFGLEQNGWLGLFASAGTSPAILKAINTSVSGLMTGDEARQHMTAMNIATFPSNTPEQFAETVQRDVQAWRKIVVENNIRLE